MAWCYPSLTAVLCSPTHLIHAADAGGNAALQFVAGGFGLNGVDEEVGQFFDGCTGAKGRAKVGFVVVQQA